MSTHRSPSRRARAAGVIVVALVAAGVGAVPAFSTSDAGGNRIAGEDRYETAAKIALARNTTATKVVLASGADFPDALAGAPLAGLTDAPVLLTAKDSLPATTKAAIDQLNPSEIYLLGGTGAVSNAVADALSPRTVTRIAGDDRADTAARVARAIGTGNIALLNGKKTAFVATGDGFADALAGAPLAAAGAGPAGVHPILLVGADVPAATESALRDLAVTQVAILGGTGAVSSAVQAKLESITGSPALRYAGEDRYTTATAVAAKGVESYGLADTEVVLASGSGFADALAGGPLAQKRNATVLLTAPSSLPATVQDFISGRSARLKTITALGGTLAVPAGVLSAAVDAAKTTPPLRKNESLTVTPGTKATLSNSESRTFTVTGATGPVDIVLVNCNLVSTNDAGNTTFTNANSNAFADGTAQSTNQGAATADVAATPDSITTVNGAPAGNLSNDDYVDAAAPTSGTLTFVVASAGPTSSDTSCVVPVVFADVNGDNALNLASNVPTELFGTGGVTIFTPNPAGGGSIGTRDVRSVAPEADSFSGCPITAQGPPEVVNTAQCASYSYDANDIFQVGGVASTLADFESRLSVGDDISGTYDPDPTKVSTFNLVDEAVPTPAATGPIITDAVKSASATVLGSSLAVGDVHTFTFDQAVTVATGTYYAVSGGSVSNYTIYCNGTHTDGAMATCASSADGKTLTVTITAVTGAAPSYPMTVVATNLAASTGGAVVDLARSTDKSIAFPD
jgi:putative cell wall-binding protein